LRINAKIHQKVFDEVKKMLKPWVNTKDINELCWKIAKENDVLCWFKYVSNYPDNVCISINDVVVHWRIRNWIILQEWDLVTIDFWIKDKIYWINTDAAFSVIIWWNDKNPVWAKMIETCKRALDKAISKCKEWNTIWDIWHVIQKEVESAGFKIIKDLTWHSLWKTLHEKPYVYNYWNPWKWVKIKTWMVFAIEPIIGQTSWKIVDKWDWELYVADGSLGCQYEHTVLITNKGAEVLV
jgi:methionyl aminopeptidase